MTRLDLYHDWSSFCCLKVRLCLEEKGLAWNSREVNLMRFQHLDPAYLAVNPDGLVPALVHDGAVIPESTVINEYLDDVFPDPPLRPRDPVARARMRAWVKYEDDVLHPVTRPAAFALLIRAHLSRYSESEREALLARHPNPGRAEDFRRAAKDAPEKADLDRFRADISKAVDRLEATLSRTPWLAGKDYSLADVAAAPFVDRLEELGLFGLFDDRPGLGDWIARLKARPAYRRVLPESHQRLSA